MINVTPMNYTSNTSTIPTPFRVGENLEFTRNLREIYEKKTSEVDLGVVKDKGGGEQFLNMTRLQRSYEVLLNTRRVQNSKSLVTALTLSTSIPPSMSISDADTVFIIMSSSAGCDSA